MSQPADFMTERFADGTEHKRLDRLTDGRVMCCLCFSYVTRDKLTPADEPGTVEDVCKPCRAKELAILARQAEQLQQAAALVTEAGPASTSLVQQHLGVTFREAHAIMRRLEKAGTVGPERGRDGVCWVCGAAGGRGGPVCEGCDAENAGRDDDFPDEHEYELGGYEVAP